MTLSFRLSAHAVAFAALLLTAGPALAHHPMGGAVPATAWQGFASGIGHPVIGLDHLAFLVATGLAVGIGRLGAWLPLLFVGTSLAGVVVFWLGLVLPGAELLVAATLLVAGMALATGRAPSRRGWAALLAFGGLAHGQAYAEAVLGAEPTPVLAYLLGLALVQSAITGGVALLVLRWPVAASLAMVRVAGLAIVLVGAATLARQALAGG